MNEQAILTRPTSPFPVDPSADVRTTLLRMSGTGFQGRSLGEALRVWEAMHAAGAFVFLGISGALVPAGMRLAIKWLIDNDYVHCVVSTGAQLFHDIHENLGYSNYQGNPHGDDSTLRDLGIDRMYDIYASETEFRSVDSFIMEVADRHFQQEQIVTTASYMDTLGRAVLDHGGDRGIVTACHVRGVPLFVPALGDSSIGIALAVRQRRGGPRIAFDIVGDVLAMGDLVDQASATGVVFLGGGTPKNYIQQSEVVREYVTGHSGGHDFGIQITTDAPHWGGLSGCTFKESESWGKYHRTSQTATVYADATIALPLLVTALAQGSDR